MKKTLAAIIALPILVSGGTIFSFEHLRDAYFPHELSVTKGGESSYVIVRPDGCDFPITAACSNFSRDIKKQTGTEIKVVTDKTDRYAAGAKVPCEILVGNTNRDVGCDHADSLLYNDFSVCVHGNDIVMLAGNNDGYAKAAEYIRDNFINGNELCIPTSFYYLGRADYAISSLTVGGEDISEYDIVCTDKGALKYAEDFASTLREKTGVSKAVKETSENERAVIFGFSDGAAQEYKVVSENKKIYVSSPSAMGLEKAYEEFTNNLFGKEEKNVTIEKIDVSGSVSAPSEYTDFIVSRNGISNSFNKLTKDKKLTVAYFGGSVTVGHASSDRSKYSWRALTTQWLSENFPDAEVVEINSAIGASGSHLGAFRTEKDVIAHKPDLLFVEFSINDCYNGETASSASENYEAIVRQVRKALPECDIVNVYITDSGRASGGGDFAIKTAYENVAQAYGIPSVDVGKALITKKFLRGNSSSEWSKYFTDIVHMNDTGFAEYAKVIAEFMACELIFDENSATVPHPLPEKINPNSDRELSFIMPSQDMLKNSSGFSFVEKGFMSETPGAVYDGYLKTTSSDNSLTFTFTGTELSLFMSSYTSGTVTYEIDGKKWRADRNSMNNPFPIVKNLEYGKHTITMQFGFKNSTTANIGAFLVR